MAELGQFIAPTNPLNPVQLAADMGAIPPIPVRKPFGIMPDEEQLMQFLGRNPISGFDPQSHVERQRQLTSQLKAMTEETPFELLTRPLSAFGAQGAAEITVGMPGVLSGSGGAAGGVYYPEGPNQAVSNLLGLFGEIPNFSREALAMTFPELLGEPLESTYFHETAHRGVEKLRRASEQFSEENFIKATGLGEEGVVRLLDYVGGTDVSGAEAWFAREHNGAHPEDFLEDESVLDFIVELQARASSELKKSNIDVPIHFGSAPARSLTGAK